jgi:hypothetical protein
VSLSQGMKEIVDRCGDFEAEIEKELAENI